MIELIIGTYGVLCWLLFAKFRLIPVTTYTVCTAILIGIMLLAGIFMALSICHPVSHDCRLYMPAVQIVPQVRGTVTEVPVVSNTRLSVGDVLFRIDPRPYQFEVDRLEAQLASVNVDVAQLEARLAAAQAQTRLQQSNLLISESEDDRQARVALEQAAQQITQTTSQLELAQSQLARETELIKSQAISQKEFDQTTARVESLEAELGQAVAAERGAQEKLKSGSNRMQAAREALSVAEAQERDARLALEAEDEGVNPEVRQIMAELENKRWELEQTVVRAPSDGFVTQVFLRPGQMAVPFPMSPTMIFVPSEKPMMIASFRQNVIKGFEPGLEAELAFKAYPGRIYKAKVLRILPIIPEGTATVSGQLRAATSESASGLIPVVFEYDEDIASLQLPIGSQASIAVYTHKLHALSIVRKIILRMKSWENYVIIPFDGH